MWHKELLTNVNLAEFCLPVDNPDDLEVYATSPLDVHGRTEFGRYKCV